LGPSALNAQKSNCEDFITLGMPVRQSSKLAEFDVFVDLIAAGPDVGIRRQK
jgi:hypothetical protein